MPDKPDGTYRTRREVREMQAHPRVEQEPVVLQAKNGYRVTIPAVVVSAVLAAIGSRQMGGSPELRSLERVERQQEILLMRLEQAERDRRRDADVQRDRDDRQDTCCSLNQSQLQSVAQRVDSLRRPQ